MHYRICKTVTIVLFTMLAMFCLSCTEAKCKIDQTVCNYDCPSTIGVKQACEQKCNLLYDICRSQK
ncbi:MAG TPA: hypothetical protein PK004_02125 [Smithella sp.]|jgi:hypothetical protein|nr:hypothetical protein [Smithella sp.]NMC97899.1 hypothetical protein [Deltaproteobacteria bacterium]OQC52981.1 MAG: hypothetical protein BWX55_01438 [Deltaproteobacteria bacterium ADurb.Bin022]HNQ64631.1 hypothetical protein [Smithella sp.]HOE31947.1 hypothetical protein [Smithella sp.]